MKKRDKANEYHKKSMRDQKRKVKSSYVGIGYESKDEFKFPELSEVELEKFKCKLKKQKKLERIKTIIILVFLGLMSFLIISYLLK